MVERVAELPPPTPAEKDDDGLRSNTNHIENEGVWLGQTIFETPLPQDVASCAIRTCRHGVSQDSENMLGKRALSVSTQFSHFFGGSFVHIQRRMIGTSSRYSQPLINHQVMLRRCPVKSKPYICPNLANCANCVNKHSNRNCFGNLGFTMMSFAIDRAEP